MILLSWGGDPLPHRRRSVSSPLAIGRSKEYSKSARGEKEAITFPRTATERIAHNEAWNKNAPTSEEAKTRIAKRLKEAGKASRKSAGGSEGQVSGWG